MVGTKTNNCEPAECECCECHGHEWVITQHDNGVGHSWTEAECEYCDAEITQEELEAIYEE